jgi:hypothetical protein
MRNSAQHLSARSPGILPQRNRLSLRRRRSTVNAGCSRTKVGAAAVSPAAAPPRVAAMRRILDLFRLPACVYMLPVAERAAG